MPFVSRRNGGSVCNGCGHDLTLERLGAEEDMTSTFAVAWVRETRTARNAKLCQSTGCVPH